MKSFVTLGQIGCGYWGPNLLRVFTELEGAKVKWLCDLKPGRLLLAQKRYPHLRTTQDYRRVLEDKEVHAVIIATEVVTHFDIASLALKAGKHVFIEKPMAHSSSKAQALVKLAFKNRLTLGVGHVFIYHPAVQVMKKELQRSRLGRLCYIDCARVNPGPPIPKHNVIWDMAPHDVAVILHLVGRSPKAVRALARRYSHTSLEEAAFLEILFGERIVGHIHVSWMSSRRVRRVEAYAEKGSMFYDDVEAYEKLRIVGQGEDTRVGAGAHATRTLYYNASDIHIPALPPEEPLKIECADFLSAVRNRRQPLSGSALGFQVVQVLEAACSSAKADGSWVKFQ